MATRIIMKREEDSNVPKSECKLLLIDFDETRGDYNKDIHVR